MKKDHNRQAAHEIMIFLGVLILILFILRLWPILLLALVGVLICALRMLWLSYKITEQVKAAPEEKPIREVVKPIDEKSIYEQAFSLYQRRITEEVTAEYPGAHWIWAEPKAYDRFICGDTALILLNNAGGYQKALVKPHNLTFAGLSYETVSTESEPANSDELDTEELTREPANYELLAFDWVEKNLLDLNALGNETIAQGENSFLIPSEILPHPDSWPDICEELLRNGFAEAEALEYGIQVSLPH